MATTRSGQITNISRGSLLRETTFCQEGAANTTCYGVNATATEMDATAIGFGANASHSDSTAIGTGSATTRSNQMVLGKAETQLTVPNLSGTGSALVATKSDGTLQRLQTISVTEDSISVVQQMSMETPR